MIHSDLSPGMRRAGLQWSAVGDFPQPARWEKAIKTERNRILKFSEGAQDDGSSGRVVIGKRKGK